MEKIKLAIIEDILDIREGLQDYFDQQEETECIIVSNSMEDFFGTYRYWPTGFKWY